jgi:hypothetical protein
MVGHGEGVGDSPERRGDMEVERSDDAVGFLGGSRSPMNGDGSLVILQLCGPKKVERRGFNRRKIGRGALTPKAGGNGGVLTRKTVRQWTAEPETCTVSLG